MSQQKRRQRRTDGETDRERGVSARERETRESRRSRGKGIAKQERE